MSCPQSLRQALGMWDEKLRLPKMKGNIRLQIPADESHIKISVKTHESHSHYPSLSGEEFQGNGQWSSEEKAGA